MNTTAIISVIIAALSLIVAICVAAARDKKDDIKKASEEGKMFDKLESIDNNVKDIKAELRDVTASVSKHSERLAITEQQIKELRRKVYGEKP